MSHISGRPIAINHAHGGGACVGELMKKLGRNVNRLACLDGSAFGTQAHFAHAFENQVDFFLLLVVPGDLPPRGGPV